jgi:biopolymer transport protein ExbD
VSEQDDDAGLMSAINVTPFVDVVLVLLVIFMVTAPMMLKDSIRVQLPKTQTSDGASLPQSLGIAINRDGQILMDGVLVSEEELVSQVKQKLIADSKLQGMISADVEASYGKVARAIDLLKVAGLERFAIQVIREGATP